ncbi:MAG: hypothetical protein KBA50_05075 [Sedimentibacter sp.]|nr:hypothetical protein [Sedimentibacter sp.]
MTETIININEKASVLPGVIDKKIGSTVYEINIFFNAEVNTKVEDKIFRLIKSELSES